MPPSSRWDLACVALLWAAGCKVICGAPVSPLVKGWVKEKMDIRMGATSFAISFRTVGEMLSGPGALAGFRLARSFSAPSVAV